MEFCSKFAYDYGFSGSDSEDIEEENKITNLKKVRKADTNIISVAFDKLTATSQMFAGEPKKCKNCEAIMTKTSRDNLSADKNIWICEFCFEQNSVKLTNLDEVPNEDDVTFLIEPAPEKPTESKLSNEENTSGDDKYLIYCVDISGSMNTSINRNYYSFRSQAMSRLGAVKIACIENLRTLKTDQPQKRVGFVTFSDEVKYYGDATNSSKPITMCNHNDRYSAGSILSTSNNRANKSFMGNIFSKFKPSQNKPSQNENVQEINNVHANIMDNKEEMLEFSKNQDGDIKPIKKSHSDLERKITNLRTEGSTALGPALTFCIGFLSRLPGSQVILCTDGCANVGMGSVESGQASEQFYEDLAIYAKNKGIVVNVITMESTDCRLALLGKVADLTNGTVNIVNPLNLSEEFKSILQNRLVATDVKAKLIVNNKYLYIRDDDLEIAEAKAYETDDPNAKKELEKLKKSIVEKNIGNANVETEITFEFGVKRLDEDVKKKSTKLDKLPFQLQISYTMPNGAKALRVYTKIQKFTQDRKQAENEIISKELIWANYAQKMSNHISNSSASTAQYRGQQLSSLMSKDEHVPELLKENLKMIKNFSFQTNSSSLNDVQTRDVLKAKKANRKMFL
ncbi:unnamed protein product [Brachionus calyciflorus]|uniref:Circularly permutated Ras protein 1 n=1 Tax=Brachionus calyciflorus TaxID=104777 RepID=A0A813WJI9_9BILA|nr:unnamed protein product [Brachionus calyciflorus]